jgi:hypothetical protein
MEKTNEVEVINGAVVESELPSVVADEFASQIIEFAKVHKYLPKLDMSDLIQKYLTMASIKGVSDKTAFYYCWSAGGSDIPASPTVLVADMIAQDMGLWMNFSEPIEVVRNINAVDRRVFRIQVDLFNPRTFARVRDVYFYAADQFLGDWEDAVTNSRGQKISKAQQDTNKSRAYAMRIGNAKARARRTAIMNFSGLRIFFKQICQAAKTNEVQQLSSMTLDEFLNTKARVFGIFQAMGISKERILANLGRSEDLITASEVATLRGIYQAITDGQTTAEDAFPTVLIKEADFAPVSDALLANADVDEPDQGPEPEPKKKSRKAASKTSKKPSPTADTKKEVKGPQATAEPPSEDKTDELMPCSVCGIKKSALFVRTAQGDDICAACDSKLAKAKKAAEKTMETCPQCKKTAKLIDTEFGLMCSDCIARHGLEAK